MARAVGLACDSPSSESVIERNTTVDFIVPGEMELTTAVRSVSNATMARYVAAILLQGDPAPCSKPPVDIDVKVAF